MDTRTREERRWARNQALACTRIEGHVPTREFLGDCEAIVNGTMTLDQVKAASLARALAADRAALAEAAHAT
ncbi:MAG: antitoxin VbhA family protein [Burkholderiales bacterium]